MSFRQISATAFLLLWFVTGVGVYASAPGKGLTAVVLSLVAGFGVAAVVGVVIACLIALLLIATGKR